MDQDFIFARDVILDPETGKRVAIVRNGEIFRDGKEGARIAVFVGAHLYDLNGNFLGSVPAGALSLPIALKRLLTRDGGQARGCGEREESHETAGLP